MRNTLREKFAASPVFARVAPFVVFLALTFAQGHFGEAGRYWIYLLKTLAGAWFIWLMRPFVSEMRWAFSWEAIVVGIGIFAIWIGLDGLCPTLNEIFHKLGLSKSAAHEQHLWNPHAQFGESPPLAWTFIVVRILGSSIIVPPLEETFYRSFLYRWIAKPDFQTVPLNQFHPKAFIITALIFGFAHHEWLAGILCAAAYQWLVLRKNRLGDAMTAHAITNFLLGLWVVWKGAWNFW